VREHARGIEPVPEELSLGELVGRMSSDLSALFRQEMELAKVELKEEAAKASKGVGLFGGAGLAGYMTLVLLSFAAAWGLAEAVAAGWAFLIVGAVWAVAAAVLFTSGRKRFQAVHGPQQTKETVKEDVAWVRGQMN
jgi:uncharacterized membrane protein YqjE